MIADASLGPDFQGVAPKANLHSAAFGSGGNSDDEFSAGGDDDFAIAANKLARLGGDGIRMRAINVSTIRGLQEPIETTLDGNSFPTKFIDWSARVHDVLYAVGWGNDDSPSKRVPTDNFNGLTVAASQQVDPLNNDDVYRKFASVNSVVGQADFPRYSISLIAPGQPVDGIGLNDQPFGTIGTSSAAPHVTATVALLQQYSAKQMAPPSPNSRFDDSSQKHEVMKAVMLNAADKLNGVHGSIRDVLNKDGVNWLQSVAYTTSEIPLDPWIGAGHLNAKRSVQQLRPGEYDPGTVPTIAWDYQSVGNRNEYVFSQQIGGGNSDYIAATLVWDRRVEKESPNNNFQTGEQFFNQDIAHSLNNLDLYLMPASSNDLSQAIAKSISTSMSVEHIFFKIPQQGNYKLVVHNNPLGGIGDSQNYALAWWFGDAPPLPKGPGDHDGDGDVDAADNVLWRKDPTSFGGDPGGYDEWRANYGNVYSGSGAGTASVPEPTAAYLAFVGMLIGGAKRCRAFRTPITSAERLQRGLRTTM